MSTKMPFNFYTMTGHSEEDTEMLLATIWDDLDLLVDADKNVYDISGNYIAKCKIVGVGNGLCC